MFIIFPEATPLNIILYTAFGALALSMGPFDYFGAMPMRYSKFRAESGIPSRAGMFLLYFVPLLAALGFSLPYLTHPSLVQTILLASLLLHYTKRCLEVLFLHKYSGPMEILTTLAITGFYTLVAAGASALNATPLARPDAWFWLGLLLFATGEALNFWHHKILANLRQNAAGYLIPHAGLFKLVACPHYLFELLAWLGLALISRHLFLFIAFVGMFGYLLARSIKTLAWYRAQLADFPKDRKALIPWLI